jgi:hypothetical protein
MHKVESYIVTSEDTAEGIDSIEWDFEELKALTEQVVELINNLLNYWTDKVNNSFVDSMALALFVISPSPAHANNNSSTSNPDAKWPAC